MTEVGGSERQMQAQRLVERQHVRLGHAAQDRTDPLDGHRPHLLGLGLRVDAQPADRGR